MSATDSKQASALTELDLFRQVASSLTKKMVTQDPSQVDSSKKIFDSILRKLAKVWKAFSKFLKNQCENKQKAVDTQVIGLFIMKEGTSTLSLYPSPEYLEAGKFKLPKFMRKQMMDSGMTYEELYNQIKAKTELSIMNFGSLGSVCNLQQDNCKQYLTDFFSCLIEINRKTKRDVKLSMGSGSQSFGSLHLFSNGEIFFEKNQDFGEKNYDFETQSVYRQRSQTRDDLSTVIDNASAILSQNGGKTFSVRSGFLSNLSSVATPKSCISQRNFKSAANNTDLFSKYKAKSKQVRMADDIFESKPAAPPKESDNGLTSDQLEYLNQRQSRQTKSMAYSTADQDSTRSSEKHPHLDAFIQRGMGNRYTKKYQFQREDKNELLQFICDQMQQKKNDQITKKVDNIMDERQDLRDFKKKLMHDQMFAHGDKLRKKLEFLNQNEQLINSKVYAKNKFNEEKFKERMNYFPFTHGDAIEKQRTELAALQKTELNEKFIKRELEVAEQQRIKQEKFAVNKELTDARLGKMIEQQKKDEQNMLNQFSELEQMRNNGQEIDEEFQRQTAGQALVPTFPAFTRSIKKQHQSRFGAENPLFAKSMKLALERHEEQLRIEAAEKEMQRQDFIDGQLYEKIQEQKKKEELKVKNEKYRQDLNVQAEYARNQKQLAFLSTKELVNTNLGPEENSTLVEFKKTTKELKKLKHNQELQDQALAKIQFKKTMESIERDNDLKVIEEDIKIAEEAKEKEKVIQDMYKERNARVWIEQTNIKYKQDQVDNLFV